MWNIATHVFTNIYSKACCYFYTVSLFLKWSISSNTLLVRSKHVFKFTSKKLWHISNNKHLRNNLAWSRTMTKWKWFVKNQHTLTVLSNIQTNCLLNCQTKMLEIVSLCCRHFYVRLPRTHPTFFQYLLLV